MSPPPWPSGGPCRGGPRRSDGGVDPLLEEDELALAITAPHVELDHAPVLRFHVEVHLRTAFRAKAPLELGEQPSSEALSPPRSFDRQMVHRPAVAVPAAEDRSDDDRARDGDQEEAGVAATGTLEPGEGVGRPDAEPRARPELPHRGVVGRPVRPEPDRPCGRSTCPHLRGRRPRSDKGRPRRPSPLPGEGARDGPFRTRARPGTGAARPRGGRPSSRLHKQALPRRTPFRA